MVDPDVDRLAIVMENGEMFVEEYTLVAVADYVLRHTPGATVSNLSSSRALRDVTEAAGCSYSPAAVGEVNVVTKMKETGAVIGGEGNGGVIYPEAHYGRDALVGVALFLTLMAKSGKKVTELKAGYPAYAIAKNKIQLTPDIDVDAILEAMKERYKSEKITDIDGVKIDFPQSWVHLRKSNTEPIIRIYAEAHTDGGSGSPCQRHQGGDSLNLQVIVFCNFHLLCGRAPARPCCLTNVPFSEIHITRGNIRFIPGGDSPAMGVAKGFRGHTP